MFVYELACSSKASKNFDHACEQLRRRIICLRMGKASFTDDPDLVDEENGVFLKLPQDFLTKILSDPVTCALCVREVLIPFFKEYDVAECLKHISNLGLISQELVVDQNWLSRRLAGSSEDHPTMSKHSQDDGIMIAAHVGTPMKLIIKAYLISKVKDIPGTAQSTANKGI